MNAECTCDKSVHWGVELHPEDHAVQGGTWTAWDVLDYGDDKNSAQWVLKGLPTRRLMRKIGERGRWEYSA